MHAGSQPPLGVTETTQPAESQASIDVVPRQSRSSYRASFSGLKAERSTFKAISVLAT